MKRYFKSMLLSLGAICALLTPALLPASAQAAGIDPFGACKGVTNSSVCSANQPGKTGVFTILKNVINILLTIIGIVAVIMVIVGGIKYTTSAGDSNAVGSAKNTILYAIVGLVIAAMSFAIINYVLKNV